MTATTVDPALFTDPDRWVDMDRWHREVAAIRAAEPVAYCEPDGYTPFWALTRHADVFEVSRHDDRWLNTVRSVLGPDRDYEEMLASGMPLPATLVHLDGDEHTQHRHVANDWFKPASVKRRQPRIDQLADEFVERMRDLGGACDFARDVAQPFTLRVIMDIYGVPEEDEPLMLDLTQGVFGANDPEFLGDAADPGERVMSSVMQFIAYFNDLTADRRACPADDLASVIANGEVDGELMDDVHRIWYFIIVATAGHDTTSFALSGGMQALLDAPDQLRALAEDVDLAGNAAEEILRWTSPVRHFMRYATEDSVIGGVEIPAGGRVLLSYPAVNRDPDAFPDPDTFDIRRPGADRHLGFGVGAHFCLGAQFARREIRTLLGRLAPQLAHVERAGDAEYAASHFVSGVKHLPVSYRWR